MPSPGKTITCRAAVVHAVGAPYVIETVQVEPPKAGEVRIQMKSTGLCHSDLHMQEGCNKSYIFPAVFGHEGAGVIESVGAGVDEFVPGDVVVPIFEAYCGKCALCKNPNTNRCLAQTKDNLQSDGTSRVSLNGKMLSQMGSLGTFNEYTVCSVNNVTKVNPKAPVNRLCLAGCCIPTGYGAAMECAKVKPGSTCAIWGLGGVGMNVVMGCRDSLASKIIGVDVNPSKFPLAKQLGCTDFLNPKEHTDVPKALAAMTDGGVDYCFVSVGMIPVMEQAFDSSHPFWGTTVVIGLSDMGARTSAGVWELLFGRVLKGTYYGSYKAKLAIPKLVEKVMTKQIDIDALITHVLPLDKINEGFDMLRTGESIRAIIDFDI